MELRISSSMPIFASLITVWIFTGLLSCPSATAQTARTAASEQQPSAQKPASQQPSTILLPASAFSTQGGNEFILDFTKTGIPGLPAPGKRAPDGVDLRNYDLEITFSGVDGRQIQLWFKNSDFMSVYSFPVAAQSAKPIRFNPMQDKRNVNEFSDFSRIYAVGAKIFGGLGGAKVQSARLTKRK